MRAAELEKMFRLEDTYWWFVARRALVRDLLTHYAPPGPASRRILDIGCGTGATLATLEEFGEVIGMDRSREALRFCRRRGRSRLALALGEALPLSASSVDIITALDLLEHIEDDAAAVREMARALAPGGLLLVTVPALPFLWSEHDEALAHVRRYRARRLRGLLEQAGLEVVHLTPVIATLLLPIALLRLAQRFRPRREAPKTAYIEPPTFINRLLIALLRWEGRWVLRHHFPVGVSLVAIARKAGAGSAP